MKDLSYLKKSIYSGLTFFMTVLILSIGYATLSGGLSTADRVGSGSGLTATSWNRIVDGVLELDTRTVGISSTGGKIGIGGVSPGATLYVNGSAQIENAPSGSNNKNPIRGGDFTTTSPADYSGTPSSWTNANQSITLPTAGTYLVIYNAQTYRNAGTRGDTSLIRLSTTTDGVSGNRALAGAVTVTSQSSGTATIIHTFTVSTADTVQVQAYDWVGGSMQLFAATITYIRIG